MLMIHTHYRRVQPEWGVRLAGLAPSVLAPAQGDVILAINGQPVRSVAQLFAALEPTQPGDTANLTVRRGGETRQVAVELSERPR